MKILYLSADLGIPVLGRKGASVHVRSLVAALGRAGHSVAVATPSRHESPWEDPARLEASLLHLPPGAAGAAACRAVAAFDKALRTESSLPRELQRLLYNQDLLRQLLRRFEGEPPDFIYERASLYTVAGVCLARELEVPLLVELNAPLALEQSTYRAPRLGELAAEAERWTLRGADAVLVVSAALRDHAASLGVVPERIHVVPNGVDAALFRPGPPDPEARARWGLGDGPILGFVGGLRPWHGVDALPRLLDQIGRASCRERV